MDYFPPLLIINPKIREIMKKITDMKKMGALALGLMAFAPAAMAQDKVETSMGADIVSQYYWRGQDLGAVSLQPTLGIGYKGFSLTAWGSVGLSATGRRAWVPCHSPYHSMVMPMALP